MLVHDGRGVDGEDCDECENHVRAETKSSESNQCEVIPIQKMTEKATEEQKSAKLKDKVQTVRKSLEEQQQQTVQQFQAAEDAQKRLQRRKPRKRLLREMPSEGRQLETTMSSQCSACRRAEASAFHQRRTDRTQLHTGGSRQGHPQHTSAHTVGRPWVAQNKLHATPVQRQNQSYRDTPWLPTSSETKAVLPPVEPGSIESDALVAKGKLIFFQMLVANHRNRKNVGKANVDGKRVISTNTCPHVATEHSVSCVLQWHLRSRHGLCQREPQRTGGRQKGMI